MEIQPTKTTSLIACSNRSDLITKDAETFKKIIHILEEVGKNLSESEVFIIKKSADKRNITVEEFENAITQAYEDVNRYGAVSWNHIIKHLPEDLGFTNRGGLF